MSNYSIQLLTMDTYDILLFMLGQIRPLGARTPRVPSWTAESLVPQPSPAR